MTAEATVRRRRSVLRGLIITAVVLALIGLVADVTARWLTESVAAKRFQTSQHLSSKPSISIKGFPFLTQLARRRFDHVQVSATGLVIPQGASSLRIASLHADLYGLSVAKDLSSATARSGTGQALISYPDLSQVAGVPVSWAGNSADSRGRVRAAKSVTVLGQSLTATVSAEAVVAGPNEIHFDNPQVTIGGIGVPQALTDQLSGLFPPLTLKGLPDGLAVRDVVAQPDGVVVTLVASNVTVH